MSITMECDRKGDLASCNPAQLLRPALEAKSESRHLHEVRWSFGLIMLKPARPKSSPQARLPQAPSSGLREWRLSFRFERLEYQ